MVKSSRGRIFFTPLAGYDIDQLLAGLWGREHRMLVAMRAVSMSSTAVQRDCSTVHYLY